VAPAGGAARITLAELVVARIEVTGDDGVVTVDPPAGTDVLAGVPLALPEGDWTSVTLELGSTLDVLGTDEGAFDLSLEVDTVGVQAARLPFELGEPHVFELASEGWLTPERAGWDPSTDRVVRPGDVAHDAFVEAVQQGSSLRLSE
jgi:hypothetical protein